MKFNVTVTKIVYQAYSGVEAPDHDAALRLVVAGECELESHEEGFVGAKILDPDGVGFDYALEDSGDIIVKEDYRK